MSVRTPVDAVALAARIRDELPSGSAQHYAAMVILNNLVSYSEQYGIILEPEARTVVASLSVEYLYLAWYYGVEIKLNQAQTKYWPHQIWKDSASLGINLKEMVQARQTTDHNKLRNARTLLSFGAVVNQYFDIIRAQNGGLETFKTSYCPAVPGQSLTAPQLPETLTLEPKPVKSGWSWRSLWGRSFPQASEPKLSPAAIGEISIPGSMPPPPASLLPFSTWDATPLSQAMESLPSVSTSVGSVDSPQSVSSDSTWTVTSIDDYAVDAMGRLEAYLSVIGTPHCEGVKAIPIKKKRLVSLDGAEKAFGKRVVLEPIRIAQGVIRVDPIVTAQREPWSWSTNGSCAVRWMSGDELKARQDKLDAHMVQEKIKQMKKMKWKGAKSAQLMPQRVALLQFHAGLGSSPLANEVMSGRNVIIIDSD